MTDNTNSFRKEEARIHEAYKKRTGSALYSWFSPGHLFLIQEREREILLMLRKRGIQSFSGKTILEVGCGTGYWIRQFINWGASPRDIVGIDLLSDRVTEARRLGPETVNIECRSATDMSFADNTFDFVLQSMVFSSVLDSSMKQEIAAEMFRVVKPNGLILWYDFHMNNPKNPDVRGVKKHEIHHLFPSCRIDFRRITLAPPLVRKIASYSWLACYLLEKLKIFNTHYLGIIQKSLPVK